MTPAPASCSNSSLVIFFSPFCPSYLQHMSAYTDKSRLFFLNLPRFSRQIHVQYSIVLFSRQVEKRYPFWIPLLLFPFTDVQQTLTKAGMPKGVSTELWVLEHPDILANLQKAYVEAGSQIVYAPTFGANRLKLADYGRENEVEELNARLVDISKKALAASIPSIKKHDRREL